MGLWRKIMGNCEFWRPYVDDQSLTRLNIGAGPLKIEGAVNLDIDPGLEPDVVHDLTQFPYPFEDNTFDYVHCSKVIEHLLDTIPVMEEIGRITKPGGLVYVAVPHFASGMACGDPTHVSFFSTTTFKNFYAVGKYMKSGVRFPLVRLELHFSKIYKLFGLHWFANRAPHFYEDHWAYLAPAKYIHAIMRVEKDASQSD